MLHEGALGQRRRRWKIVQQSALLESINTFQQKQTRHHSSKLYLAWLSGWFSAGPHLWNKNKYKNKSDINRRSQDWLHSDIQDKDVTPMCINKQRVAMDTAAIRNSNLSQRHFKRSYRYRKSQSEAAWLISNSHISVSLQALRTRCSSGPNSKVSSVSGQIMTHVLDECLCLTLLPFHMTFSCVWWSRFKFWQQWLMLTLSLPHKCRAGF